MNARQVVRRIELVCIVLAACLFLLSAFGCATQPKYEQDGTIAVLNDDGTSVFYLNKSRTDLCLHTGGCDVVPTAVFNKIAREAATCKATSF